MDPKQIIVDYYRDLEPNPKRKWDLEIDNHAVTTTNPGLGDCLALFCIEDIVSYSPNIFYPAISKLFGAKKGAINNYFRIEGLQTFFALGGGHFFQRVQRAFKRPIQTNPRSIVVDLESLRTPILGRVIVNFEAGMNVVNQRKNQPRARELYPEHREIIQKFILSNQNRYSFVEVGRKFSGLQGVINKTGLTIDQTALEVAMGDYFLGIHSGLEHLAHAFHLKCVILANITPAHQLILPALKDVPAPDIDWLYPTSVYLHTDESGPLVQKFDEYSLEAAFDGKLYPFFSEEYCDLYHDFNK